VGDYKNTNTICVSKNSAEITLRREKYTIDLKDTWGFAPSVFNQKAIFLPMF